MIDDAKLESKESLLLRVGVWAGWFSLPFEGLV